MIKKILLTVLKCLVCVVSVALVVSMVLWGVLNVGLPGKGSGGTFFQAAMMDD